MAQSGHSRNLSHPLFKCYAHGVGRWDISGGQVLKDDIQDEPNLFQASYYYGLNNYLTGYTGIQITDNNYTAGLLGLGLNTSVGAFSFDVTHSNVRIPDDKNIPGAKLSCFTEQVIRRNKYFTEYRGYRYSTQNYLGLNDALTLIDEVKHPEQDLEPKSMRNYSRMKNQVTVSINQPLKFEKKRLRFILSFRKLVRLLGFRTKIVAITLLATVTVHPGAATVSVPSVHGMKTATLTIAFILVSPFQLKKITWH
ncbi:fimbria/pilus outer membrane usher protein [Escherichia coli]